MRQLEYAVEGKAANLKTFAMDEPGHGGACHRYRIQETDEVIVMNGIWQDVVFQNGPIGADGNGVNGIQHEDLLAIIIDRLEGARLVYGWPGSFVGISHAPLVILLLGTAHRTTGC